MTHLIPDPRERPEQVPAGLLQSPQVQHGRVEASEEAEGEEGRRMISPTSSSSTPTLLSRPKIIRRWNDATVKNNSDDPECGFYLLGGFLRWNVAYKMSARDIFVAKFVPN